MQPFFWNKIAATAANDTVWCSIQEDEDLDLTELVKDFAADTKIAAKSPPSIQSRVTSLLHLQRAQNIGKLSNMHIMLLY